VLASRFSSCIRKSRRRLAGRSSGDRIAQLRVEISNLMDAIASAIASGAPRTSKAVGDRLAAAETELDRAA
jgi:hypothetical protein